MLPFITRMINASLRQGRLPDTQKHAIVTPLLKKPGLDVNDMANYVPPGFKLDIFVEGYRADRCPAVERIPGRQQPADW